jgi:hypothetical protein
LGKKWLPTCPGPNHREINDYLAAAILKHAGLKKLNSRKSAGKKKKDKKGD